ncbi:hypothetical protein IWW36_003786 [Coemansia brasiliensis]|uniref:Uncharacterized protein n=1 Tax=Coemansia brasiliensis TaxID=2650707 RepID=A0A9W8LWW2_9FUNG|nr:hypothetical protein IWW36_003786 [Coemansia brasiliensis]
MPLPDPTSFQVLETTVYTPQQGIFLLCRHLQRINNSAQLLSAAYGRSVFSCHQISAESVAASVYHQISDCNLRYRVRLLLSHDGQLDVRATEEQPTGRMPLVLDCQPTDTDSVFVRCKTTHRPMYTAAAQRAEQRGAPKGALVLMFNRLNQITESNIANVAVSVPDEQTGELALVTPPLSCGLLAGTMRQHLLDSGRIREGIVTVDQFRQAAANGWPVICMNSVRGEFGVDLVDCA